jgi:hypothetical protein
MKQLSSNVYKKLQIVSDQVKKELQKKGVAIPVRNTDGSIALGNYTIAKRNGFYVILDYAKEVVVDQINLPQTAAILANNLALGKWIDEKILKCDRHYGYAEFEETLHIRMAEKNLKKNVDRADMLFTKGKIKHAKKEDFKREIIKSFEKLRNFA